MDDNALANLICIEQHQYYYKTNSSFWIMKGFQHQYYYWTIICQSVDDDYIDVLEKKISRIKGEKGKDCIDIEAYTLLE